MDAQNLESKLIPSIGGEDSWEVYISKKGKPKAVFKRENISLLPVEIIIQQMGSNYFPPPKEKITQKNIDEK
jgi:hypothetical protein